MEQVVRNIEMGNWRKKRAAFTTISESRWALSCCATYEHNFMKSIVVVRLTSRENSETQAKSSINSDILILPCGFPGNCMRK